MNIMDYSLLLGEILVEKQHDENNTTRSELAPIEESEQPLLLDQSTQLI